MLLIPVGYNVLSKPSPYQHALPPYLREDQRYDREITPCSYDINDSFWLRGYRVISRNIITFIIMLEVYKLLLCLGVLCGWKLPVMIYILIGIYFTD